VSSSNTSVRLAGPEPVEPIVRAFLYALRELGYVEGRNLVLQRRSLEGRLGQAPIRLTVDVLISATNLVTAG
jgi:hypothetical protein